MPIDFNPNALPPNTNNIQQQHCKKSFIFPKLTNDTFVKTIYANNEYKGIKISKKDFGTIQKTGEKAQLFTITNKNGASVELSNFGATIVSIKVPDKDGKMVDAVYYNNADIENVEILNIKELKFEGKAVKDIKKADIHSTNLFLF